MDTLTVGGRAQTYPDVPPQMLAEAKELEAVKRDLAEQRGAAKNVTDPKIIAKTKALRKKLTEKWNAIRALQARAEQARRETELEKQAAAAKREALRRGRK